MNGVLGLPSRKVSTVRRSAKQEDSLLQPGTQQVAAGYVLYGSSTVFTLTLPVTAPATRP